MIIRTGNLNEKASPYLVTFVLICSIVITGLLFVVQRAEALRDVLYVDSIAIF